MLESDNAKFLRGFCQHQRFGRANGYARGRGAIGTQIAFTRDLDFEIARDRVVRTHHHAHPTPDAPFCIEMHDATRIALDATDHTRVHARRGIAVATERLKFVPLVQILPNDDRALARIRDTKLGRRARKLTEFATGAEIGVGEDLLDRKSTRLNSIT